jgi:titin
VSATTAGVTGLTLGTPYTFTVTATNEMGSGQASTPSSPVTAAEPPAAPTAVSGRGNADGSVTVTWTAPDDNGSAINGYLITPDPACTGCTGLTVAGSPAGTSTTIDGLSLGTPYSFTVTATNAMGDGPASTPSSPVTAAAVPGAPSAVSGTANPDGSVTVTWTAPAADGSAIDGYLITPAPACTACTGLTVTGSPADTTATVTGLTLGTPYTFTVSATNAIGAGPASGASPSQTDQAVPGKAAGLSVVANPDGTVGLSWTAAADDGAQVSGYTVNPSPSCSSCGGLTVTGSPAATATTVTGLTLGTAYTFTLRATNAMGIGSVSTASPSVTAAEPPDAPTAVSPTANLNGSVGVTWQAPADRGAVITQYAITPDPACSSCTGLTVTGAPAATSATVDGLSPGTAYRFTVDAINAMGAGPASTSSASLTPAAPTDVPGTPTAVGNGNGTVTLTWAAPTDGGPAIIGYTVTPDPACPACTGLTVSGAPSSPQTTASGLTPGRAYTFTVTTQTVDGPAGSSGPSGSVTPGTTSGGGAYTALQPFRVCDTRAHSATECSGTSSDNALGQGQTMTIQVAGVTGSQGQSVPADAQSVVLNLTGISGTADTYLTAFPAGSQLPTASNLNINAGTNQANLVVVGLGSGGKVSIYNSLGRINLAVDVEGYFAAPVTTPSPGEYHSLVPLRICDSRSGTGTECSGSPLGSGQWEKVVLSGVPAGAAAGTASIPTGGTAAAAVLNLTAVSGSAGTFLSVVPPNAEDQCPSATPSFSNLNVNAANNLPNRVIVPLGPDQDVCVYNSLGTINFILDVNGWFGNGSESTPGALFYSTSPTRVCDTRAGTGTECSAETLGSNRSMTIHIAGEGGVPAAGPVAIIANVTAVSGSAGTYFTLYPAGAAPPTASDLNVNASENTANLVVVGLSVSGATAGEIALYNSLGNINAIVDIAGWFA